MAIDMIMDAVPKLVKGCSLTLQLVSISLIFGMILALPTALMRVSKWWLLRGLAYVYIFMFRGTPLLVQVYLIYYSLPYVDWIRHGPLWAIFGQAYWCAILALTLNTAAYTAEIFRGAIQAVPKGEIEAGRAVGMSPWVLYRRIILPQAFRLALPAYGNEIVLILKASSLASTITLLDLMGMARTLNSRYYAPYEIFLLAGLMYLIMTYAITRIFKRVESRLHLRTKPIEDIL